MGAAAHTNNRSCGLRHIPLQSLLLWQTSDTSLDTLCKGKHALLSTMGKGMMRWRLEIGKKDVSRNIAIDPRGCVVLTQADSESIVFCCKQWVSKVCQLRMYYSSGFDIKFLDRYQAVQSIPIPWHCQNSKTRSQSEHESDALSQSLQMKARMWASFPYYHSCKRQRKVVS